MRALHVIGPASGGMRRAAVLLVDGLLRLGVDAELASAGSGVAGWRLLRRRIAAQRPDVLHAHGLHAAALCALAAPLARIPLVVSVHSVPFHAPAGPGRVGRAWLAAFDAFPRADVLVLAVSEALAEWLRCRLAARRGWVRVAPPPAIAEEFQPVWPPELARRRLALADEGAYVGYVGRLSREKGVDLLLRAWSRACGRGRTDRPARLVLVGDGPEGPRLRALAARLGLGERVVWAGRRADAGALMPAFDVVAMPSRSEGLGLAALEALACGVPVIASRVGGLPEALDGGRFGLLVGPDDEQAWARALADVLSRPLPWRWRARLAAPWVRERFTPVRAAAAVVEGYRELLERAGRGPAP